MSKRCSKKKKSSNFSLRKEVIDGVNAGNNWMKWDTRGQKRGRTRERMMCMNLAQSLC